MELDVWSSTLQLQLGIATDIVGDANTCKGYFRHQSLLIVGLNGYSKFPNKIKNIHPFSNPLYLLLFFNICIYLKKKRHLNHLTLDTHATFYSKMFLKIHFQFLGKY